MAQSPIRKIQLTDDDGNPLTDDNGEPIFDNAPDPVSAEPIRSAEEIVNAAPRPTKPLERLAAGLPQEESEPSFLSRAWQAVSEPLTTVPSQVGRKISDWITTPDASEPYFDPESAMGSIEGIGRDLNTRARGFIGGATEGVGDVLSSMTSPIDLAAMVLTGGESIAAKQGAKGLAKGLGTAARISSAPVAAHGAQQIVTGETLPNKLMGGVELAGGLAGMRPSGIKLEPTVSGEIAPKKPSFRDFVNERNKLPDDLGNTGQSMTPAQALSLEEELADIQAQKAGTTKKPKFTTNGDGTYTNVDTGEIVTNKPKNQVVEPVAGAAPAKSPTLTIKEPTVQSVGQAAKDGYKYVGQNPDGSYQFEYVGNKTKRMPGDPKPKEPVSLFDEVVNFPRTVMASNDMSAPLRQGLPLIHKKEFWKAIPDMFRAWGSEEAFNQIQQSIRQKDIFKPREFVMPDGTKQKISIAEQAKLAIMDLDSGLSNREEALMSTFAEKLPGVRRGNRAYTAFLNKLRADTFESLMKQSGHIVGNLDTNMAVSKELANFVNTATGRGSLGQFEQSAKMLNRTLFAPRLIASRINLPMMLVNENPTVRKEALKSLAMVIGVGNTVAELAKLSGMATVENDPASSDFRKIKVGNIRLDPYAGFQQYAVLFNRMITGEMKSSTTGKKYDLGNPKFGGSDRFDVGVRFLESKLNPIASFVAGLFHGKDPVTGQPFNIPNEVAERMTPIIVQDIVQLATENPTLLGGLKDLGNAAMTGDTSNMHPENLPFAIPAAFGASIQQYDKNRR